MLNFNELYNKGARLTESEITQVMHKVNNMQGMDNLIDYSRLGGKQVPKSYVLVGYDSNGETYFQLYETDANGLVSVKNALDCLLVGSPVSVLRTTHLLRLFISNNRRKKFTARLEDINNGNSSTKVLILAIKGGLSG